MCSSFPIDILVRCCFKCCPAWEHYSWMTVKQRNGLAVYVNHCVNWGSGGVFPEVSKERIVFIEAVSVQHAHPGFDPV